VAEFSAPSAAFTGAAHCIGLQQWHFRPACRHAAAQRRPRRRGHHHALHLRRHKLAIAYVGARPVYVDIDEQSMNLDPGLVERAITPRTKVVMPVHLYGHPFAIDRSSPSAAGTVCRWSKMPPRRTAPAIAAARSAPLASWQPIVFIPENLGACGEGGALVTNRADYAARAAPCANMARTALLHDEVGYNYRMEGIQGAVLGVKLRHLPAWNAARRRLALRYHELLAGTPSACRVKRLTPRASIISMSCATRPATGCANTSRPGHRHPRSIIRPAPPAEMLRGSRLQAGEFPGG